ncbi:TPA: purine-binding chemotaxis protein CheW [Candidatus Poribacteria bacterium]|nr:purine-binding chemotaxis protein CheW [Candidatus Poribacteria bacterium]
MADLQFVSFNLDGEKFGVDILSVREIVRMQPITRLPNVPDFIEGVINLRGEIIPVIDLRKRLGMPPGETDKKNRIMVVELGDKRVGLAVDAVSRVLKVNEDEIEPPPEAVKLNSRYITGIAKLDGDFMLILDLEGLISMGG